MKLMPYSLGVLPLTLFALLAPTPGHAAPADGDGTAPAPAPGGHTAAEIARFLREFYGDHGPSEDGREKYVSQVLKDKQKENEDADVLLCAENEPEGIGIGPVTVAQAAGVGWATVTTHWGSDTTDTFTAYVRLDSEPIRLDDVICAG
ncbi:hypothetical protein ACIGFK_27760 [Streptomyces sp. NPDC085524]|uniref:hypothetical protein n=1 Tax=unclassified Streptomyces TaxID=2593676 RepID=UPI00369AF318